MFIDFGLLSSFNIDNTVFCRWLFTVKKNYRNDTVKYHNWYHAFNVTQLMFSMLKATDWVSQFSKVMI
jgi:dual 3',5'-cyclic-AMP and -GMP phosphodiesterase 11